MNAQSSDARPARGGSPARRRGVHIAEVAALAGVSIATVSRALSMPGRVSAQTRDRVLEVVRQTGYTPNGAGRSLRAARSNMILVVIPTFITPFFRDLHLGIDRALSMHGYGLLLGSLQDPMREGQLIDLAASGQADGVLLLNGHIPRSPGRSLADTGVPIVGVSVPPERPPIPMVLIEERDGGAQAGRHLLALGHRRLGYIGGPEGHYIERERWAGFRDVLLEGGIATSTIGRYAGDFHVDSGVAAARQYLSMAERPTAIFAISDMMAIGFMRTVHAAGLKIPADVSVVGFDGIEFADYCEPPLTTVRQPREAMGGVATELLLRLIAGEEVPLEARLEVTLRSAGSTGPAP